MGAGFVFRELLLFHIHDADNVQVSAIRKCPGAYAGEGEFIGAVHSNALLLVKAEILGGGHNPHRAPRCIHEPDALAPRYGYGLRRETFIREIHDGDVLSVFKYADGNYRSVG